MFFRNFFQRKTLFAWAAVGAVLTVASPAFGQTGYGTTFDDVTAYPLNGGSLSGQGGWDTTDPDKTPARPTDVPPGTYTGESIGQADYVGTLQNYSPPPGTDYYAFLGGLQHGTGANNILPGSLTTYLYHDFSLSAATTSYAFNVDFSISNSTTFPSRDTFGWTFRAGTGTTATNLFSVNFTPSTTDGTKMNVGYTVNGTTPSTVVSSAAVKYNGQYHLTLSVNLVTNQFDLSLIQPSTGTVTTVATGISLAGIDPKSVTEAAATWILVNTPGTNPATTDAAGGYTSAGGNALIFNNYFVTVPEPSTYAMVGLGIVALAWCARRRARA